MEMKTIIAPITLAVADLGYVPPGTKVTLPADEADSIVERFGEGDPNLTISLEELSQFNAAGLLNAKDD